MKSTHTFVYICPSKNNIQLKNTSISIEQVWYLVSITIGVWLTKTHVQEVENDVYTAPHRNFSHARLKIVAEVWTKFLTLQVRKAERTSVFASQVT